VNILGRYRKLLIAGLALLCSACGGETFTPAAKRADAIEYFKLSGSQIDIMDAYYEGITKKKKEPTMSRRFTRIAGCYADLVEMPDRFDVPHRAYIRDFEAVEKNYYPWFKRRGVNQNDAYDIGQRVKKAADKCHLIIRR
jgi:hypothetical protein